MVKNVEKQDFPTMHGKVHMKYQYSEQLFINIITVNYIYIIIGIVYLYQYTSTMTVTICTIFNMLVLFRRRISPHHHWESSSRQNFVWRLLVKASKRGARAPGVWRTGKPGGNAVTVKRTVSRYINQTIFLELQTTIFCNGCFN